jgi:hypothetical protein
MQVQLVDFLMQLLQTHGKALQRLAAFFGEEVLLHLLEDAGERLENEPVAFRVDSSWFEAPARVPSKSLGRSPYSELEGAVQELNLPSVLEFYLWTYPFYRKLIEGPHHLRSQLRGPSHPGAALLTEGALEYAKLWIKQVVVSPEFAAQAERSALTPWLRFRAEFLKKMGTRPIVSL